MYHVLRLMNMIKRHEGKVMVKDRHVVYDDATGERLKPGYKLKGHPTIGYGMNLEGLGITEKMAGALLTEEVVRLYPILSKGFESYGRLGRVRQDVILDMAFNMGVVGLGKFKRMWSALHAAVAPGLTDEQRQPFFNEASDEMKDSAWHKQVGSRATELEYMMETGQYFVKEERGRQVLQGVEVDHVG